MEKRIALLRGINIGGKKSIKMMQLKELFEQLGFSDIKSYIQSGNIVFNAPVSSNNNSIETIIQNGIREQFSYEVPTMVLGVNELEDAIQSNPYFNSNAKIEKLHLTILGTEPDKQNIDNLQFPDLNGDEFQIIGRFAFIYCQGKYHKTKLGNNAFESKLKVNATTRNWKTVLKLLELSKN